MLNIAAASMPYDMAMHDESEIMCKIMRVQIMGGKSNKVHMQGRAVARKYANHATSNSSLSTSKHWQNLCGQLLIARKNSRND